MTTTLTPDPVAELVKLRNGNADKMSPEDFAALVASHSVVVDMANDWLDAYNGDFGFVLSMKAKKLTGKALSVNMLKGVANCMLAEHRYNERKAKAAAKAAKAPKLDWPDAGYYAIDYKGELRFFRVKEPGKHSRWYGRKFLNEINGGGHVRLTRDEVPDVLDIINTDPMGAASRYGMEIGSCGVCNRVLTDPLSRSIGIGPVCRMNTVKASAAALVAAGKPEPVMPTPTTPDEHIEALRAAVAAHKAVAKFN